MKMNWIPEYKYELKPFGFMDNETIVINLVDRPSAWVRFWMFTFFRWRFKPI